ncbi:fibronectin type III domain-containing protein [Kineosporia succinea]|uniref:Fibronectin type-III domain-containing protein n=1 Tax=Kineosporia succinea TaxID=84632 RepID=A0ABT9PD56_9ACTN|nr:fibronectin type III domain-containing protein [Kineosporia succinea]MDP9830653.1 hypothetical protein [Kineosporia succinea]
MKKRQGVGLAACAVVFALVLGGGLLGAQATGAVVRLQDGGAWLANAAQHSVTWVNGYAGQAGKTVPVGSLSSPFTVVQRPDGAYAIDENGNATLIDGAQLKADQAPGRLGTGVDVVANESATWLVDHTKSQVQRLDPATLEPSGQAVAVKGVTDAVVDDEGFLWAAIPTEGVVVRVWDDETGRTEVGRAGETLTVAADEQGAHVVAVNTTSGATFSLHGDDPARSFPALPAGSGADGLMVDVDHDGALLIGLDGRAVVVPAEGEGRAVTLPSGTQVDQVDIVAGVGYVTDRTSGSLVKVDLGSGQGKAVPNVGDDDLTDVVAHGNLLYLNDSGGNQVKVVKPDGVIVPIEKYRPGQDPTQADPVTPQQPTTPANEPTRRPQRTPDSAPDNTSQAGDEPSRGPRRNTGSPAADRPSPEETPEAPATPEVEESEEPEEPQVPGAPVVTATADDAKAVLEWRAARANGSPVTGYEILLDNAPVQQVGANELTATIGDLTNGQQYDVRVRALSDAGEGALSRVRYVTPSADLPGVPANVTATPGDQQIAVSWAAAEAGRTPVVGYTVTLTATSGGVTTVEETGLQATVPDLTNGTRYVVRVAARSAGGTGEAGLPAAGQPGSEDTPAVPSGEPGAITFGTPVNGDGKASVTWTAADAQGSDITGYQASVDGGAEKDLGNVTSWEATGLANDVDHTVRVRAVNANGQGEWASVKVSPASPRKTIYQCANNEVRGIYMLNLTNDCNNAVAQRWDPGVKAFDALSTAQTGSRQMYRCVYQGDRALLRRTMASCPSGWSSDGPQFYSWSTEHAGATKVTEYSDKRGTESAYYYVIAGQGAPSGFSATGTVFWV